MKCNHLFVLDNGKLRSSVPNKQVCTPKLMIFNLENDKLIKTIYIPIDIATNSQTNVGYLMKPIVYLPEGCRHFLNKMIISISSFLITVVHGKK